MISTHIGAPAGETAEICVEDNTVNEAAGLEPKFTSVAPFRLVPLMITVVPPATGPEAGDTDETVGAGIGGSVVVVVVVVVVGATVVVVVGATVVVVVVDVVVVVVVAGDTNTVVVAVDTSPSPSVTVSETGYEPTVVYRALASAVVAV